MSNQELISKLELALSGINGAIDELGFIDGMESYCEKLIGIAMDIETELDELLSVEESAE
jgi:hypothetical protein